MGRYIPNTDRWGYLELIDSRPGVITALDRYGKPCGTDPGPDVWILQCECGHAFEIDSSKFPGKRRMRTCGRVEHCEYARQEAEEKAEKEKPKHRNLGRPPKMKRGAPVMIYMGDEEVSTVKQYATEKEVSFSHAARELIHYGHAYVTASFDKPEAQTEWCGMEEVA